MPGVSFCCGGVQKSRRVSSAEGVCVRLSKNHAGGGKRKLPRKFFLVRCPETIPFEHCSGGRYLRLSKFSKVVIFFKERRWNETTDIFERCLIFTMCHPCFVLLNLFTSTSKKP